MMKIKSNTDLQQEQTKWRVATAIHKLDDLCSVPLRHLRFVNAYVECLKQHVYRLDDAFEKLILKT